MDEWIAITTEAELQEGKALKGKAGNQPVVLARVNGTIYAMDNVCPHLGCFLHRGELAGHLLTCPCHDWVFDLRTGEFTAAPEIKIPVFPVKVEHGEILVHIGGVQS